MTSGGNNFNYFPENQLTKFKLANQLPYFFAPPPPKGFLGRILCRGGCLWTPLPVGCEAAKIGAFIWNPNPTVTKRQVSYYCGVQILLRAVGLFFRD